MYSVTIRKEIEDENDPTGKVIVEHKIYFYLLLELQSSNDFSMPIRIFSYIWQIWRDYITNQVAESNGKRISDVINRKTFKLPAVVPIVLYNGSASWTASRNLKDCIANSELFGKYVVDFEYILIDINNYTEEDLVEVGNCISAIFMLDQKISDTEFVSRLSFILREMLDRDSPEVLHIKNWLEVILPDNIKDKVMQIFDETKRKDDGYVTATIARTLAEQQEQALQRGLAEGRLAEKYTTAKKLLDKGMDEYFISDTTGLSVAEIKKLLVN